MLIILDLALSLSVCIQTRNPYWEVNFITLPAYIQKIKDKHLFERKLKQLLVNGCYYSVEDFIHNDFTYKGCCLHLLMLNISVLLLGIVPQYF
jgi:hypothetical protein